MIKILREVEKMGKHLKLIALILVIAIFTLGILLSPHHDLNKVFAEDSATPTPAPSTCTLTITATSLSAVADRVSINLNPPNQSFAYPINASYSNGTQVTLTAEYPWAPVWVGSKCYTIYFDHWTMGGVTDSHKSISIIMDSNKSLYAYYRVTQVEPTTPTPTIRRTPTPTAHSTPTPTTNPNMYTLTLSFPGLTGTSLEVNPPGVSITSGTAFTYDPGTVVTLKANNYYDPSGASYVFYQWQGDLTGYQNPATITVNGNKTVQAVYAIGDPPPPTPTPVRTPTTAPTATPVPGGNIKVQFYNQSIAATTNQIYTNIKLINTGTAAILLSNVKIRYYYTIDGVKSQNFYCDYSPAGSGNITGTFMTMATPKTGADTYLEVGFTSGAGSLTAGASVTIQGRFAKSDWSNYTQTNDYSFNTSATTYVDWAKVAGYVSGALQWGAEP
jgi:hypothetical protein